MPHLDSAHGILLLFDLPQSVLELRFGRMRPVAKRLVLAPAAAAKGESITVLIGSPVSADD
jgi:hypothetical protein